jgi:hypothetical protein
MNYTNHLKTYKHIRKVEEESQKKEAEKAVEMKKLEIEKKEDDEKLPLSIKCKNCDKCFSFKQSMYRHMKNSCKEKDLKELVCSLNKKIDFLTMKLEKFGEKSDDF